MDGKRIDKRIACFFITLLVFFLMFPAAASADSGPKPTITVKLSGLPETECIATLLGDTQSTGPWYVDHDYIQRYAKEGISQEVFLKFREHKTEGWYFLGFLSNVTETHSLSWTYYPPQNFRVLVYMPKTDTWLISEKCSRFAFDSYFVAATGSDGKSLSVTASDSMWIRAFFIRLIVTVVVELIIALIFGLRSCRQIITVLISNIITQIALNLLLSTRFGGGLWDTALVYLPCEIAVFALEALAYVLLLRDSHSPKRLVAYAFTANLVTFLIGIMLPRL